LKGEFAHVAVLDDMYQKLRRQTRTDQTQQPQLDGNVDNSMVDVTDDQGAEREGNDTEAGQVMDVEPSSNAPAVDEDGFQLVQGRGRRKR
jgi:hypothetical protein